MCRIKEDIVVLPSFSLYQLYLKIPMPEEKNTGQASFHYITVKAQIIQGNRGSKSKKVYASETARYNAKYRQEFLQQI